MDIGLCVAVLLVACGAVLPAAARLAFLAGGVAGGRLGRGSALRSRAPESSPGRLGFRGLRSFDCHRALAMLAASNRRGWRTGIVRPLRPGSLRSKPPPTLPIGAFAFGRASVSRPIEGLDSFAPSARYEW